MSDPERALPPALDQAAQIPVSEDFDLAHDHETKLEADPGLGSEQVETDAPHLTLDPPSAALAEAKHYRLMARDAERADEQTALFRSAFLGALELDEDDDSYGY